jgi:hypothetical protein
MAARMGEDDRPVAFNLFGEADFVSCQIDQAGKCVSAVLQLPRSQIVAVQKEQIEGV